MDHVLSALLADYGDSLAVRTPGYARLEGVETFMLPPFASLDHRSGDLFAPDIQDVYRFPGLPVAEKGDLFAVRRNGRLEVVEGLVLAMVGKLPSHGFPVFTQSQLRPVEKAQFAQPDFPGLFEGCFRDLF